MRPPELDPPELPELPELVELPELELPPELVEDPLEELPESPDREVVARGRGLDVPAGELSP